MPEPSNRSESQTLRQRRHKKQSQNDRNRDRFDRLTMKGTTDFLRSFCRTAKCCRGSVWLSRRILGGGCRFAVVVGRCRLTWKDRSFSCHERIQSAENGQCEAVSVYGNRSRMPSELRFRPRIFRLFERLVRNSRKKPFRPANNPRVSDIIGLEIHPAATAIFQPVHP